MRHFVQILTFIFQTTQIFLILREFSSKQSIVNGRKNDQKICLTTFTVNSLNTPKAEISSFGTLLVSIFCNLAKDRILVHLKLEHGWLSVDFLLLNSQGFLFQGVEISVRSHEFQMRWHVWYRLDARVISSPATNG